MKSIKKYQLKPNWNVSEPQKTKKRTMIYHQYTKILVHLCARLPVFKNILMPCWMCCCMHQNNNNNNNNNKENLLSMTNYFIFYSYQQIMEWEDSDWKPIKITTFASWFIMCIPSIFFGYWLKTAKQMSAFWTWVWNWQEST